MAMNRISPSASREARVLKILLWVYIVLAVGIAGLNNALAPRLPEPWARGIQRAYEIYENEVKTAMILVSAVLCARLYGKGRRNRMRKANLLAFALTALAIHVAIPALASNPEIYYMAMPLPWSTTGLQLMVPESGFYLRHVPSWGLSGIAAAAIFSVSMNAFVLAGTLLFGRRLQCSSLCLLNGFVAELWAPVLPLAGRRRHLSSPHLRTLAAIRWSFFALSLGLSLWWLARAVSIERLGDGSLLARLETIKYLALELLMAMVFWVVWSGRGYCHYCPLGTWLSFVSKAGGQRIRTDLQSCVACGACDGACPMDIPIMAAAKRGEPVSNSRCVGCGHCVDVCPKKTLAYETAFIRLIRTVRQKAGA